MKRLSSVQDALLKQCTTTESCKALVEGFVYPTVQVGGLVGLFIAGQKDVFQFCALGDQACKGTLNEISTKTNQASLVSIAPEYFAANNQLKVTADVFTGAMQKRYGLSEAAAGMLMGILTDPTVASGMGSALGSLSGRKTVAEASDPLAEKQLTLPGMNRPVRPASTEFPPNQEVSNAMNSQKIREMSLNTHCVDCSDIAPQLLKVAGGKGEILEVLSSIKNSLNVFENGSIEPNQSFHQVYSDGKYVYDARISFNPVPKGDWEQHIRNINPDGVVINKK